MSDERKAVFYLNGWEKDLRLHKGGAFEFTKRITVIYSGDIEADRKKAEEIFRSTHSEERYTIGDIYFNGEFDPPMFREDGSLLCEVCGKSDASLYTNRKILCEDCLKK